MKCFMCKGSLSDKLTTFMVDIDECIIIVKNVPSQVCSQCGEVSYSNEVAKQLEKIVDSLRMSITEIAVTNYMDKAA
ncbi:MAG: type II toxin-antitoxin system MqsA family antitoxin [Defluviitaleaceae bacterium]|nr:type II toxin-antitoxin system MqsA family antitoxin [Defluviitaleaceae bacterium]